MSNAIPCKHCGKQCTDHIDNPQRLKVVNRSKLSKDLEDIVCDKYTPDIKLGQLSCTCSKQGARKKWCNGLCVFTHESIEND